MALGADGRHVRGMVVKQVGRMALVGGAIGIVAALGLGRLAGSMLYELEGHDPFVLAVAAVLLLVVAAASAFIPARQASRIDPMYALRYE